MPESTGLMNKNQIQTAKLKEFARFLNECDAHLKQGGLTELSVEHRNDRKN